MPTLDIPEKMERALRSKARFVVILGGRSSTKTETIGRIMLMKAQTEAADVLCGREYQTSIEDSVHKVLVSLSEKIGMEGVEATEKKIDLVTGGLFRFKGFARNSSAVRSAFDFKYCWIDEAQFLSKKTLTDLLPTIRSDNESQTEK